MKHKFYDLSVETPGKGLVDISDMVQSAVDEHEFDSGLLTLWCVHTGASFLVQANADDDVIADINAFFEDLVPQKAGKYRHKPNHLDDAPSHLRALLTQTQVSIPVENERLPLGKVQSLYLFEHREAPKIRRIRCHFIGN